MTASSAPTPPTRRPPGSRRLSALIVLLVTVSAVGLYAWTARSRHEQALKTARLTDLQARTTREPDNARAFFYLGLRLRDAGRLPEAAHALEHAAGLRPDDEEAWLEWARTVHQVQGATAAYKIVDQFLRTHPNSARSHAALAALYARSGYWSSVLEASSKATQLNAADLESWQLMGTAGLKVQDYGKAETGFRHAVELAPKDWRGYLGLSEVYGAQGRSPEALQQCREAVQRAPAEAEVRLQLGKLLLRTAATKEEVEAARHELMAPFDRSTSAGARATTTSSQAFFAAFYIGQSYQRDSNWRQARLWLESAATRSPNDPTVQHELVTVYQRLGDKARLTETTKRLAQINAYLSEAKALSDRIAGAPTDLDARLKLARLHAAHGDIDSALKDYGLLLLRAPNRTDVRREYDALNRRYAETVGGGR